MITSESELGCNMGFGIVFTVGIVLGAPVGSPLGYKINTFLGLALVNYFGTRKGYLVGVLLDTLSSLMIGTA